MAVAEEANPHTFALVERARRGDAGAFEALIAASRQTLATYVRVRIGEHLRHRLDVEDVLQESFVQAWKSMASFRWTGDRCFERWLAGIAEHVILKTARRRGDQILYVKREADGSQPSPSTAMRRDERFKRFEDALHHLSPDHRQAILLVRIQGLSFKEAGERMGRTAKSVMHLVARGLKKLKENFGDTESYHLPQRAFQRGADSASEGAKEIRDDVQRATGAADAPPEETNHHQGETRPL